MGLGTWPLNPKAMDNKFIKASEVYIASNVNNVGSEKNYTT
jgi:hypothetical protein